MFSVEPVDKFSHYIGKGTFKLFMFDFYGLIGF